MKYEHSESENMIASARLNHLGFWVGCIDYKDGTKGAVISNAKHTKEDALRVAETVIDSCRRMEDFRERQLKDANAVLM